MSGLGRRLRDERDLWKAVWQHVDTFLDRIDSSKTEDETHVATMCALFPVFDVVERARQRSVGYRLQSARKAVPGGADANGQAIAQVSAADLLAGGRVPGVEDCEFACAPYAINSDGEIDDPPKSFMSRSVTLARFRDEKHGNVLLRTPTYEFGDLTGLPMIIVDVGDKGLFPREARDAALNGDDFTFTKWRQLRNSRVAAARSKAGDAAVSLSTRLSTLLKPENAPIKRVDLLSIGASARQYAGESRTDAATLTSATRKLSDAGVDDTVSGAVAAAAQRMHQQAGDFDAAANQLSSPAVDGLGYGGLASVRDRLINAEGVPGLSGLPLEIEILDAAASGAMNDAVENRIGYPDGPLRQLRMLQWSLRFFWEHRKRWMQWRHDLVLAKLYGRYLRGFTNSLTHVLAGQRSGIPLPDNSKLGKQTLTGATELPLAGLPDLSTLVAGQLVVVRGDRPAVAPVVDVLFDGKKMPPMRLKVPALLVSADTGRNVPGTPGLIPLATPLGDHHRKIEDDEFRRGQSRLNAAENAYIQALIVHRSRLALVLGNVGGGAGNRPAAPAIAAPYAGLHRFEVEGPVTASANRLFLKSLPHAGASGTGEQLPIARPGELMLLFGHDQEEVPWQVVVEIDRVAVVTAAEAKKDEEAGATPVPPCCPPGDLVMVVYVRSMQLPPNAEFHGAFLHRSFAGFGARSLVTGVMLPEDLDGDTSSTVQVGADTLRPRRDLELASAVRVFEDWMPKETS